MTVDLKDDYFHIHIAPHHRLFLRFAFERVAYQHAVLPFGLFLALDTFMKSIDVAFSPLRQMGICILNYSDDWLVLARSERELAAHRELLLSHLERLGLVIIPHKSQLLFSQRAVFLETILDSAQMDYAGAIPNHSAISGIFQIVDDAPPEGFPEVTRPNGSHCLCNSSEPASHAAHSVLAQSPHSTPHLGRLPVRVDHHCIKAVAPWMTSRLFQTGVRLGLTSRRKVITTDASNSGWGRPVGRQSGIRLLVSPGATPAYQLPRDVGGFLGPENLLTGLKGAPRLGPVGQHDGGCLHQSPRWSEVMHTLQDGSSPPLLGTEGTPLIKGGSCARQIEPWHRYAVQRQGSPGRMGATFSIWSVFGKAEE